MRLRKGARPDLVVQLPDGTHAALAVDATDYGCPPGDPPLPQEAPTSPVPLLDLDGLRQAADLLARIRAQQEKDPDR